VQRIEGPTVNTVPAAARGTTVTSTATCPSGRVLYGGGATVATGDPEKDKAVLVTSAPTSTTLWTATAVVQRAALASGQTMTVTAVALCGIP